MAVLCIKCNKVISAQSDFCEFCGAAVENYKVSPTAKFSFANSGTLAPTQQSSYGQPLEHVRRLNFRKRLAVNMMILLSISIVSVFFIFVTGGLDAANEMASIRSISGNSIDEAFYQHYGEYLVMQGGLICGIYETLMQFAWVFFLWLYKDSKSKLRE